MAVIAINRDGTSFDKLYDVYVLCTIIARWRDEQFLCKPCLSLSLIAEALSLSLSISLRAVQNVFTPTGWRTLSRSVEIPRDSNNGTHSPSHTHTHTHTPFHTPTHTHPVVRYRSSLCVRVCVVKKSENKSFYDGEGKNQHRPDTPDPPRLVPVSASRAGALSKGSRRPDIISPPPTAALYNWTESPTALSRPVLRLECRHPPQAHSSPMLPIHSEAHLSSQLRRVELAENFRQLFCSLLSNQRIELRQPTITCFFS